MRDGPHDKNHAGNTTHDSHSSAQLEQSQADAQAGIPRVLKAISMFRRLSTPAAAFLPRAAAWHGHKVALRSPRGVPPHPAIRMQANNDTGSDMPSGDLGSGEGQLSTGRRTTFRWLTGWLDGQEKPAATGTWKSSATLALPKKELGLVINRRCPFAQRAYLAMEESGLNFYIVSVDPYEKPEWLLKLNPKGQVPTLIDEDGLGIAESEVIVDVIAQRAGRADWKHAPELADKWRRIVNEELRPAAVDAAFPNIALGEHELPQVLHKLNGLLVGPYVTGDSFGVADISSAPIFQRIFDENMVPEEFDKLHAWWHAVSGRPAFKKTSTDRGLYWWFST